MTDKRAWHYTVGVGMAGIAESKSIRPSTKDVGPTEVPVIWFSASAFEPTIMEARWASDDRRHTFVPKGPQDYRLAGTGLYRLGLSVKRLIRYRDAMKSMKISFTRRRKLETIAMQLGSEVHRWYVALEAIELRDEDLSLELFDGKHWVHCDKVSPTDLVLAQQTLIMPELKKMLIERRVIRT